MDNASGSSSSWDATLAGAETAFAGYEQPSSHHQANSYEQLPAGDYTFPQEQLPYLEPLHHGTRPAGEHRPGGASSLEHYAAEDAPYHLGGYIATSRSHSNGSPSPALPALSPPSTAGSSWDSSPTSLHSPYALSPSLVPPPHSPTKLVSQHPSYLLPSFDIYDSSTGRDAQLNEGSSSSPFAHAQDTYLQQHAQVYSLPSTPTRQRTASEGVPSSATPRGHVVQNALSYRSPGPAYSPTSSPSKSPYSRSHTPTALESPSRGYLARSTSSRSPGSGEHLTYESPSKRRQMHLSIDVPPYQPRSPSRNRQQPQQLDPSATTGFEIVGEVELEATQEMEQLLGQLDSILGPDATIDSPLQAHRVPPPPAMSRAATFGAPQVAPLPRPAFNHAYTAAGPIDISGVRLNPEDMSMLDEPEFDCDHRQYPASAPAWQTTFNLPPSPYQRHAHVPHYTSTPLGPNYASQTYSSAPLAPPLQLSHSASYQTSPLSAPLRPRSTPLDDSYAGDYTPLPPPASHRRRSSVDDLSSFASSQASTYSYHSSASSSAHPYARPAPVSRHTFSPSPSASSSISSSASSPPRLKRASSVRSSPTKAPASPRKTRASPVKKKEQSMFVNFSANDSKKLLSGVAPSGSSKRRREEAEAREAARAAAVAAQA